VTTVINYISRNKLLVAAIVFFGLAQIFSFLILEADRFANVVSGAGYGDAIAWAHSAKAKHLYGVWFRPDFDDWRPIFMVPIHSILTFVGFKLGGFTLTGLRLFPAIFTLFTKILLVVITFKTLGRRLGIASLVLIPFFAPLSELSRTATMDSIQTALIFFSVGTLYFSDRSQSFRRKYSLAVAGGLLLGLATIYKISALLLPLIPIGYVFVKAIYQWPKSFNLVKGQIKWLLFVYGALFGVLLLYAVFWFIPHLDEFVYFSWRMFGIQGNIVMPWKIGVWGPNLFNIFNSPWAGLTDKSIFNFHGVWIVSLLTYLAVLLWMKKDSLKPIDMMIQACFIVFIVQCVFFDMQWRRYFGLMPLGYYALFSLIAFATKERKLEWSPRPNLVAVVGSSFLLTVIFFRSIYRVGFEGVLTYLPFMGLLMLGISATIFLFKKRRKLYLGIFYGCLMIIGGMVSLSVPYTFRYYTNHESLARDNSILLSKATKNGRVLGGCETSLYGQQDSGYLGSWAGQSKPARWEKDGLDLYHYTKKLKEYDKRAKIMWLLETYYPGFLARWNLPKDYETRYRSNLFAEYDGTFASKHLIIGASEANVFVEDWLLGVILAKGTPLKVDYKNPIKLRLPRNHREQRSIFRGIPIEQVEKFYVVYKVLSEEKV